MTITYTQEDCMAGMARYPDRYFDLAIVDPQIEIPRLDGRFGQVSQVEGLNESIGSL